MEGFREEEDKKKVPYESESSDTDFDSEEKGSEADMKEIMAMFSRSSRKGSLTEGDSVGTSSKKMKIREAIEEEVTLSNLTKQR